MLYEMERQREVDVRTLAISMKHVWILDGKDGVGSSGWVVRSGQDVKRIRVARKRRTSLKLVPRHEFLEITKSGEQRLMAVLELWGEVRS